MPERPIKRTVSAKALQKPATDPVEVLRKIVRTVIYEPTEIEKTEKYFSSRIGSRAAQGKPSKERTD